MCNKKHLTIEGLRQILAIKSSMNLGISDELKIVFPDVIPVTRPIVKNQIIEDPQWLAGFTGGEGCFMIKVLLLLVVAWVFKLC